VLLVSVFMSYIVEEARIERLCCSGEEQAECEILEEHFAVYDGQFEYGSQLPAVLLR